MLIIAEKSTNMMVCNHVTQYSSKKKQKTKEQKQIKALHYNVCNMYNVIYVTFL